MWNSFFQYVSISQDFRNMTTFAFQGYEAKDVMAEGSLNSSETRLKFFYDSESYFIAVADNNVYFSALVFDVALRQYTLWSETLQSFIVDDTERTKWIKYFSEAILVIYQEGKFFMLTEDKFLVMSQEDLY